ncbi:MAG TPA: aspartate--tRNA ligase [Candidatus Limnocylindria bacterium]|jgi:aspartyl-tRNA synthetase|nr:aspartate--tRNA ligase [Candidatus Limnocylindria bacterium]
MLRTHTAGELRAADTGKAVTLAGWVDRRRDHGDVTFIDLRDRYGKTQIVANASEQSKAHAALKDARSEWVLQVRGTVRPRPEGTRNPKLPTGDIEVAAQEIVVLNEAKTPPFYVNEETPVDENLRWKYRYIDLRRERSKELMHLRSDMTNFIRSFFVERGFWEIETTLMIRSDPTGARDFVVPSRYYPGKFWALPQSPQQLKQILMVGGIDKYVQIARCFRDEDPRADRIYELTQLDVEMSFAEPDDIMSIVEECYTAVFERFALKPLHQKPWPRITYDDAMRRYGSDRPDTRFGMELVDLTDHFRGTAFAVFKDAIDRGGTVRAVVVPGKADASRKEVDAWTGVAKTRGAKGLVSFAFAGNEVRSPIAKFLSADELSRLRGAVGAKDGDLVLAVAADHHTASVSIGTVRSHLGQQLSLADASTHHALWVHRFPMFERTPEGGWTFSHNPFSGPLTDEDARLLETDPGKARSTQYDLVVDGNELGGGSVRIHNRALQERVFGLMGMSKAEAAERFGALLDALEYGAPPEGGIATGIDRTVMILAGLSNARETIAFPKTQTGYDPLLEAPAALDDKLLEELGLRVVKKPDA